MPARRTPKVEALVVNAIRRLQDVQGSTSREISNYISQEYDIPSEETRRQVQFALRRGLSYGILKRSRGGYYSCNHDYLGPLSLENGMGDGVMEPCPSQPWRFGVRKRRREKRRRRLAARKRRERERRERERKKRERRRRRGSRGRSRARRRRGRRPSRRRRTRRRRGRRRRRTTRSRRRGGRARTRADLGGMEMETMHPEPRGKDEEPQKSETSISEHSIERHSQNSQSLNTIEDRTNWCGSLVKLSADENTIRLLANLIAERDRPFVFPQRSVSGEGRIERRAGKEKNRETGRRRFAAKPKILMSAGMLKPGISSGGLPEKRYSLGGHARPRAIGLESLTKAIEENRFGEESNEGIDNGDINRFLLMFYN